MDIFGENNIRGLILDSLSKEPKKGTVLVEEIKNIRKGTTKQGVYKALRALIKEKIVVRYRKNMMLNQIWISKVNKFIKQTDENYLREKREKILDTLEWMTEGSKISYIFSSYDSLDKFHSHTFSLIIKKTDSQSPLYIYNPHEWFVLKTKLKENEDFLFDWLKEKDRQVYFTIGHNTSLDKKFRKDYSSEEFQVAIDEKINYAENCYINIIGNYVIEMKNNKIFAEKLDAIYKNCADEDEASKKIEILLKTKHRIKMVLSCDSAKAKKFKTKLGKNFFIPKELREK